MLNVCAARWVTSSKAVQLGRKTDKNEPDWYSATCTSSPGVLLISTKNEWVNFKISFGLLVFEITPERSNSIEIRNSKLSTMETVELFHTLRTHENPFMQTLYSCTVHNSTKVSIIEEKIRFIHPSLGYFQRCWIACIVINVFINEWINITITFKLNQWNSNVHD